MVKMADNQGITVTIKVLLVNEYIYKSVATKRRVSEVATEGRVDNSSVLSNKRGTAQVSVAWKAQCTLREESVLKNFGFGGQRLTLKWVLFLT